MSIISLNRAQWNLVTGNAIRNANGVTPQMNVEIQKTTVEDFVRIRELAEALKELTQAYIAIANHDLSKMQLAGQRTHEFDIHMGSQIGMM